MSADKPINIIGQISHFFAVNRPLSILLMVAVLLFGLFSFWLTPKQYNPEIVRPAFAISLAYNGASTEEAVDRVVYELVEKIRTVPGVDDVYTEVRDGATITTTVIFEVSYDATKAKLDLLSQIEQHQYLRSGRVSEPQIVEINPETIPVLQIVFGSDTTSAADLRDQVLALSQSLGDIENVSEVSVHGGYPSSLVIDVDPMLLAEAGIGINEISAVVSAGQTRGVFGAMQSGSYEIEYVFDGRVSTPAEVGSLVIRDGVRVRDIATVYEGTAGSRSYVYYQSADGFGEVVVLAVSKREGSSAPVVTKEVLAEIASLVESPQYADLSYRVVGDDGATAAAEIFGLTKNLLTSIVIVALVLMLFLSTRAALVVLVAIPITLLIVFGLGYLFGQTINRITLFALILSLGLLVDSAIVVVENIYSHLKEWQHSQSAHSRELVIARAVHEIGIGLLLSTVTSVIVFLPMGYITGMMGPYMGPIAFFVPAALLVSLMVAVVITPFVAAHLIDDCARTNALNRWFSARLDWVVARYTAFLRSVLQSRARQRWLLRGALGLFLVSLILPLSGIVHFQMLPKADRDQFYVYLDLPVAANVETTRTLSQVVSSLLLADEDVTNVQLYVGQAPVVDFNGMFKGAQARNFAHQATLRVNLTPASERARSSTEVVDALRARVATAFAEEATFVRFMEEPPGPPVRSTFVAKVSAAELVEQQAAAQLLTDTIANVSGVVDVYSSEELPVARMVYKFDHEAAATYGVSVASIEQALSLLDGAVEVGEYLQNDQEEFTPVLLTMPAKYRDAPTAINGLLVTNTVGELVSLDAVLTPVTEARPSRVDFDYSTPVTYVTAEIEGRSIVYAMIDVMKYLIQGKQAGVKVDNWGLFGMELTNLETGTAFSISWGGEWEMTLENFRDLGIAMGVALILVYGVLVAQYNRFDKPAYILVTVPLGLVGILWGFLVLDSVFGIYLTATALIGFIALIGLVVNNAIIFLEYVEQMKVAGHSFAESLIGAGQARFRPILLTSLTTILGSLTIASDPVWSGLAWAIVFGLSLSTVLTLIIYPTLLMYYTGDKIK